MTLFIGEQKIDIPKKELILARNAVNSFVDVAQKGTHASKNPALYLVTLLMMYKKSSELLHEFGIENVQYVMETLGSEAKLQGDTQM